MPAPIVISLPDYTEPAQRLAKELGYVYQPIRVHRFPDGECRVSVPTQPPPHIIICQSLDYPNDKLIELLLAIQTLRPAGVKRLSLVAPYLCYMRQDKAFHPGEAVSQQIIGRFLTDLVDDLITVDAHLHRVDMLQQAVPLKNAINLSAAPALGKFLQQQDLQPFLLGPDSESQQWARQIAEVGGFDWAVANKQRNSDVDVRITLPNIDVQNRVVVLIDDVISSGHTLAQATRELQKAGASKICCLVTHALFADGALDLLHQVGVTDIWSSDSISHQSNVIHLAAMLTSELQTLFRN
jgi:ribose-phosphate pyrophosphokinase